MTVFHHFDMGTCDGVQNVVSVNDDGEIVCRDVQSGAVNDRILNSCSQLRNNFVLKDRNAYGYIAARIPITLWQTWRNEWKEKYSQVWPWATFEVMKLNSRDFSYLRTTSSKLGVPENVRTAG